MVLHHRFRKHAEKSLNIGFTDRSATASMFSIKNSSPGSCFGLCVSIHYSLSIPGCLIWSSACCSKGNKQTQQHFSGQQPLSTAPGVGRQGQRLGQSAIKKTTLWFSIRWRSRQPEKHQTNKEGNNGRTRLGVIPGYYSLVSHPQHKNKNCIGSSQNIFTSWSSIAICELNTKTQRAKHRGDHWIAFQWTRQRSRQLKKRTWKKEAGLCSIAYSNKKYPNQNHVWSNI